MSIFHTAEATCPACGAASEVQLTASVNADLRPDLREAILAGDFQAEACPKCGARMRLAPHFSYLELGRGQWILVQPADLLEQWPAEEGEARATYDRSFGPAAPHAARALARDLAPRLVFGFPALREKLLCADLALQDVTLELLKISVLRNVPAPPMADETELRLTGAEGAALRFASVVAETESELTALDVPRQAYEGIEQDPEPWAALRGPLEGNLFVDMKRLIAG